VLILAVSDLIELRRLFPKPGLAGPVSSFIQVVPKTKENVRYIRVRRLTGPDGQLPGIPLDGTGLRWEDQTKDNLFSNYDSISIEFQNEEGT
jgi:hypothetical protein